MKKLSIRLKITLWFAGALVLIVSLACIIIFMASDKILQKAIKDNLIETVSHNIDEIEFFSQLNDLFQSDDVDHFIAYRSGFLEIDDDFLDEVNSVYTALYDSNLSMIYGENPIARDTASLPLQNAVLQTKKVNNITYYVFDRRLTRDGLEGLWLRGIVAETQGKNELSSISQLSFILLPTLVLFAILGGYLIAHRSLRPIQNISDAASRISQGGDLRQRIEIGSGQDELHQLCDRFNEMFGRLEHSFEQERQFTSDASHELRTPTSVILAQCEYTLEQERSPEEYRDALRVIYRQGKTMAALVNDMLDVTRLELRPEAYPKQELDLATLTREICNELLPLRKNNISLTCQAEGCIHCFGNRELLSRALTNLVVNAYQYGRENGHIAVELCDTGASVRLRITDDGIGIAPGDQEKIFQRFYRADSARTTPGTGLGLSMVRQIVLFHGGSISVDSTLGQGSSFTLDFPKSSFH